MATLRRHLRLCSPATSGFNAPTIISEGFLDTEDLDLDDESGIP